MSGESRSCSPMYVSRRRAASTSCGESREFPLTPRNASSGVMGYSWANTRAPSTPSRSLASMSFRRQAICSMVQPCFSWYSTSLSTTSLGWSREREKPAGTAVTYCGSIVQGKNSGRYSPRPTSALRHRS